MAQTIEKFKADFKARLRALTALMQEHLDYDEEQRKAYFKDVHAKKKAYELACNQHELNQVKEFVDMLAKWVNAELDTIRLDLLPAAMETENLENVRYEGIGRVSLTPDLYVHVVPGMGKKLIAWLKKRKLGDLAQETVNSSTLKAFVRDRLKTGKEIPGDFLKVTPYTRASITKG